MDSSMLVCSFFETRLLATIMPDAATAGTARTRKYVSSMIDILCELLPCLHCIPTAVSSPLREQPLRELVL